MRRRASLVIALALGAAGLLGGSAGAAGAPPAAICSPTPQEPSSFCVASALTLTTPASTPATDEHRAAAPVDLGLDVSNTSPGHDGDGSAGAWLDHVTVNLLGGLDG